MKIVVAGLMLALAPGQVNGQDSALEMVDARIREGRIGEARAALELWWLKDRAAALPADVERSLWLRARLTVDPSLAEIDYQRLVLEFPNGQYAAGARLRLAQSAQARQDVAAAMEHYEAIARHHTGSPHVETARDWLRRNRPPADADRIASRAPREGATPTRTVYALQLGAFESRDRAYAMIERARAAGLEPRLVRIEGDQLRLLRVRIGRFSAPEAAGSTRGQLLELGFVVTIVPDGGIEVDASRSRKNEPRSTRR